MIQNILDSNSIQFRLLNNFKTFQSQQLYFTETQNYQFLLLFNGKLVRISFHDSHDLVWFHRRMTAYRNMNPFAGVLKFLVCLLEIFECFYKQPLNFCLAKFAWFLYVSHTYGYLQKYEPIRRRSTVSNLCIRNIQMFL